MPIKTIFTIFSILAFLPAFCQKDSTHFVTTWKTNNPGVTGDSTISINTDEGLTYLFDVDWNNDGVFDDLAVTGDIEHTYTDTGTYTIRIKGLFPRILFGVYSKNEKKIISIDQWGSNVWTTMYRAFERCSELNCLATDAPDLSLATNMDNMFYSAYKFNGNISGWDVSNITTMGNVFGRCYVFNQDISGWDVSNVTNFSSLFYSCRAFNQPIGVWDVSSAIYLSGVFRGEHLVPNIFNQDISSWDVDSVVDFSDMFMYCDSFNIDIGNWDVSSAKVMTYMFRSAKVFNQDLGSWKVDSVESMQGMFQRAPLFNQDLSAWNMGNVQNTWWMFDEAISFNQDISNWQMGADTNMYGMFDGASSFNQNLGKWDISKVQTMRSMLANSGMSIENYDSTLIAWQAKPHLDSVEFYPYNLQYCIGDSARALLIQDAWNFSGDFKNCTITNVSEMEDDKMIFSIYPNPATDFVMIDWIGTNAEIAIQIFTLQGKILKSEVLYNYHQTMDISELANGVYIIKVNNALKKLIVY